MLTILLDISPALTTAGEISGGMRSLSSHSMVFKMLKTEIGAIIVKAFKLKSIMVTYEPIWKPRILFQVTLLDLPTIITSRQAGNMQVWQTFSRVRLMRVERRITTRQETKLNKMEGIAFEISRLWH